METKICVECGKSFTPKTKRDKCCSDECKKERSRKAHLKWYYSEKGQKVYKEYQQSDKYKEYSKKYATRPEVKQARQKYWKNWKDKRELMDAAPQSIEIIIPQ